jgi:hypothetical protein
VQRVSVVLGVNGKKLWKRPARARKVSAFRSPDPIDSRGIVPTLKYSHIGSPQGHGVRDGEDGS